MKFTKKNYEELTEFVKEFEGKDIPDFSKKNNAEIRLFFKDLFVKTFQNPYIDMPVEKALCIKELLTPKSLFRYQLLICLLSNALFFSL